jgi:flagellar biosynthetic protein FliQ
VPIDAAVDTIRTGLTVCLTIAGPLLLAALVIGVLISFVQAITQIQEQSLTFVPKGLVVGGLTLALLPWMLQHLVGYLVAAISTISSVGVR